MNYVVISREYGLWQMDMEWNFIMETITTWNNRPWKRNMDLEYEYWI